MIKVNNPPSFCSPLVLFSFIYLSIYFWLHWVFIAACGLSLVMASGGYSSLQYAGFSLQWLLLLQNTGSRHTGSVVVVCRLQSAGSVVVAHGLSCSAACGIFPDQGLNPSPLHWQADSYPLCHQRNPPLVFLITQNRNRRCDGNGQISTFQVTGNNNNVNTLRDVLYCLTYCCDRRS